MTREVVVTGVGTVTPLGVGTPVLMDALYAGRSGIENGVGACDDFDPSDFLDVKGVRRTDRFTQMAIAASAEATAQAGWDGQLPSAPERVGCVFGTGVGGLTTFEREYARYDEGSTKHISPLTIPLLMANAAAAVLSMRYGFHGYSSATVTACAAGADAVAAAVRLIRAGELDAAITGGAEASLSPFLLAAFDSMGATSKCGIPRPFDARRDGIVIGEGAGALTLEEEQTARRRGAKVIARLRGVGTSSDSHHLTAPDPTGRGAVLAMQAALEDGGIATDEIAYVNAHGTATPHNDRVETLALKQVLGERAAQVPVSSTKSAMGHLIGASGAVEAVVTIEALRRGLAPPTLGYEVPEEGLDLDYVTDGARAFAEPDGDAIGLTSSFAFGGHNVVLAIQAAA